MTTQQLNDHTKAIKKRISKIKRDVRQLSNLNSIETKVEKIKNDLIETNSIIDGILEHKNEIRKIMELITDVRNETIAMNTEIISGWIRENTALMFCGVSRPHFRDNIAPHVRTKRPSPRTLYYNVDDLKKWKTSNIK